MTFMTLGNIADIHYFNSEKDRLLVFVIAYVFLRCVSGKGKFSQKKMIVLTV